MAEITVRLIKSAIGYTERQKKTLKGLGLGKLNSTAVLKDTPAIRGMVNKVQHLVEMKSGGK